MGKMSKDERGRSWTNILVPMVEQRYDGLDEVMDMVCCIEHLEL